MEKLKKKQKNGFTLVELLAVIVILAIILVIAVPKVMSVIEDAKKATLESTAKMIASQAEKQKVQNTVLGNDGAITCEDITNINDVDYEDCDITFDNNTAKVTITGSGKFEGLYVCEGTKTNAIAQEESCGLRMLTINLDGGIVSKKQDGKYEVGSSVTLTKPTKEGYVFDKWEIVSGTGASVEGSTLIMGSTDTTVKSTWKVFVAYGDGDTYITKLLAKESELHNGLVQTYATVNGEQVDAGIRYAGATADVKNKVYFNCAETDGTNAYGSENYNYESRCEIWRIIGVFDTKSTDSETENPVARIKIVRDAVLDTNMEWDTTADGVSYINQWGETTLVDGTTSYAGASLKQYLNGDYYNSLSSIAKGQISNALWYTGAVAMDTARGVYEDERSDATGTDTTVNYTTKWAGLIGLIYTSDFGYAGTNCGDKKINGYEESCGLTRNWLTPSSGYYWTISPSASSSKYAWRVDSGGFANHVNYVVYSRGVRPAAYLSSNVQIIGGDGDTVPYKLK